jgi:adenylate cyclase
MQKKFIRGIAVGIVAFLVAFTFYNLKIFRSLEWKSWDLRLRLFSSPSNASKDIVLFFVDQYSLDVYEKQQGLPWPWPRQIYSAVVKYLERGGAKACVFDLTLSENSRYGIEDDKIFSEAIAQAKNVLLTFFLSREEGEPDEASFGLLNRFSLKIKTVPAKALFPSKSVTLPVESLLEAAVGAGNVQFAPDSDGIYRRLPLVFGLKDMALPSLPLAAVNFLQGEQNFQNIPLDRSGQMIVRYHGPRGTYRTNSVAAIINSWAQIEERKAPQIPTEEFSGKIVLVGTSAPSLYDLKSSPFSAVYPGTEILATVIDNLLRKDFIRIPSQILLWGLTLFLALFAGIGTSYLKKIWKTILFFMLLLALPAGAVSLAFLSGYWLDFVTPFLAVVLSFMGASLLNYSFEGRQRRFIKSVFRHYLSPEVIERIIENPALLELGGEEREITSFFSDMAGFTSVSEGLSPAELVQLLNAYLSEMTDIILSQGGTLDKYEGDAIIAFWNAPLDQPDHALRACRAALCCQRKLAELRPVFKQRFGHELAMRIGLNSGCAVVGNMGSRKRFDYTAMGDTVNLASRLEGACKQYNVPILVGDATYELVKEGVVAREVDLIRVVGKKRPVRVYQIIGEKGELSVAQIEKMNIFNQAIESYRHRQWEKAMALFQKLEDDMLSKMYLSRCLSFEQFPPSDTWDGVFELKSK